MYKANCRRSSGPLVALALDDARYDPVSQELMLVRQRDNEMMKNGILSEALDDEDFDEAEDLETMSCMSKDVLAWNLLEGKNSRPYQRQDEKAFVGVLRDFCRESMVVETPGRTFALHCSDRLLRRHCS